MTQEPKDYNDRPQSVYPGGEQQQIIYATPRIRSQVPYDDSTQLGTTRSQRPRVRQQSPQERQRGRNRFTPILLISVALVLFSIAGWIGLHPADSNSTQVSHHNIIVAHKPQQSKPKVAHPSYSSQSCGNSTYHTEKYTIKDIVVPSDQYIIDTGTAELQAGLPSGSEMLICYTGNLNPTDIQVLSDNYDPNMQGYLFISGVGKDGNSVGLWIRVNEHSPHSVNVRGIFREVRYVAEILYSSTPDGQPTIGPSRSEIWQTAQEIVKFYLDHHNLPDPQGDFTHDFVNNQ